MLISHVNTGKEIISLARVGLISLALFAFSGCGAFTSGFDSTVESLGLTKKKELPPTIEPLETAPPPAIAGKNIELMWQIPNEPVDAYHVYLLTPTGEEKRHYRVPVSKLERIDEPSHGPVYRYLVPDSVKGDAASIVIRAENRFGLSEASEPMVVE